MAIGEDEIVLIGVFLRVVDVEGGFGVERIEGVDEFDVVGLEDA